MLKQTYVYGLLALLHPAIADPANFCRITGNYDCTKHGHNCNDVIGDDWVPTFQPTALVGAECFGTKSADRLICCDTANLNGGYCPNKDELADYGVVVAGFGAIQHYQMLPGPAKVKCNKVGGPHYCYHAVRIGGAMKCVDGGMYN